MNEHFFAIDDQRFRYASAIAANCGLLVTIEPARCLYLDGKPEKPCHVWRGSAAQFRRVWFLSHGDSRFDLIKGRRWLCLGWLRGHIYREGPDAYRFVVEGGYGLTRIMEGRILKNARADAGFQRFMDAVRSATISGDERGLL